MNAFCLCYDDNVPVAAPVKTLFILGAYISLALNVIYLGMSFALSTLVGNKARTPIRATYIGIFWLVCGMVAALQFVVDWRAPLSDQWELEGGCGSCSRNSTWMWDQMNKWRVPDVFATTVFAFGPLYIYYDWKGNASLSWIHAIVLGVGFLLYNLAELILHRQTVGQLAVNCAIILLTTTGFHVTLRLVHRVCRWMF